VDLEIAIVAVGLAGEEAFELALRGFGAQSVERRLSFLDDAVIALGLAQFDELDRVGVILLDAFVAADEVVEPAALAGELLRRLRIIPECGVFSLRVQLGEAACRDIPVKDASAARRATS
jgi:hypothetical protein